VFRDLGLKNRGAGRIEGAVVITVIGGRIGIMDLEETISISVIGI
jgi:hypothetical protein